MTRLLSILTLAVLSSCASPERRLVQANIEDIDSARIRISNRISTRDIGEFAYIDRRQRVLYTLITDVSGFDLRPVNIDSFKALRPEVFEVVQCVTGGECSRKTSRPCEYDFELLQDARDELRTEIAETLKKLAYPVISVSLRTGGGEPPRMKVEYFTECDFIRADLIERFPGLVARDYTGIW